ncbi:MAG: DNA polymerase I [Gammaproteobacteria bacterium]|nr:DNA polymerase I [Gammaproteobacteria bacterium]
MSKSTPPFILVDGSSYLFRAYYALPALTNSKGQPTGAIYGVLSMLKKLVKQYTPEHIAVVFDAKGKTFRKDMYPDYKANRSAMPDELQQQIKPLHSAIKALGLPIIVKDGVEADDVIGTLALQAETAGMQTLISTGDKDLAQLVNKKITLINTMTEKHLDVDGVKTKFGVAPNQIIDYLTLIGDNVDNIPGVPKVGPKTAAKWLANYKNLDELVKHADDIKGKVGEYLREFIPKIELTRTLVTIKTDVALEAEPENLVPTAPDEQTLQKLFTEFEFKKWLVELSTASDIAAPAAKIKADYQSILTKADFNTWLKKLKTAKTFAFDTETTNINAMQAEIVGLSFCAEAGSAAYVPLMHDYESAPRQLEKNWVLAALKPLLQDKNKTIIGQNLKYDLKILRHEGIEVTANLQDTLLESYVLNSGGRRHNLANLAKEYLDYDMVSFEDVAGKGVKQLTFDQIHLDQAMPYAAEDADITWQLHQCLHQQIKSEQWADKIFSEVEMPLMPILADMEYHGVLLDTKMLAKQSESLAKRIDTLEQKAYKLAGKEFNLGSPKQLQEILYTELKIPVIKKTPKGQPSTAENVLQDLALDYPLPKLILEYRSLSKLKSTYTDNLPLQINPKTQRIHTHYNQAVTATGRLSSNDPNLQNIPVRSEEGRKIRQAFIAPPGCKIVAADYSQIELRIMAHLSKDPGLVKAFEQGLDVHSSTAQEVFNIKAIEQVTPEQRRRAKAINFGLMYGMSSFGVAKQLGISRTEAQQHIDVYFSRYPGVKTYMEQAREQAAKQGYVATLMGRRLTIPEINSKNFQRRSAAERAAINAPLQGSAAEIIKVAMINLAAWLKETKINASMIMQVHDELVFEVKEDCLEQLIDGVREHMQTAIKLSVPLLVDIGTGKNWNKAH